MEQELHKKMKYQLHKPKEIAAARRSELMALSHSHSRLQITL
jgi:hypothetical protein